MEWLTWAIPVGALALATATAWGTLRAQVKQNRDRHDECRGEICKKLDRIFDKMDDLTRETSGMAGELSRINGHEGG